LLVGHCLRDPSSVVDLCRSKCRRSDCRLSTTRSPSNSKKTFEHAKALFIEQEAELVAITDTYLTNAIAYHRRSRNPKDNEDFDVAYKSGESGASVTVHLYELELKAAKNQAKDGNNEIYSKHLLDQRH